MPLVGVKVRAMGSEDLLAGRLPHTPRWEELGALAAGARRAGWRELLDDLGYALEPLPDRGWLARHEGRPVAVVHSHASAARFARLDESGRLPEGALVTDCRRRGAPWGLLTAGARVRLLDGRPEAAGATTRYLELDASALEPDRLPLLGLLAPASLDGGGLRSILDEARDDGRRLRARLVVVLREDVLPALVRELGRWARADGQDLADDDVRAELEAAALTFVFQALFLLYAESAGHLPATNPFAAGAVPGAATLERAAVPDARLASALAALAGIEFAGLEVGDLGHVYEGLLSLTNEGGRKSGGVYYTRTELVRHLVRGAVGPAFDAHVARVRELAREDPAGAADRLFEFFVLDPACGGAHFLVEVVDELADKIATLLGDLPLPVVRARLDRLRAAADATLDAGMEDTALLKRLVLERCVFGVDLSPMGAEIAKLSLRLSTFVPGLPLPDLDHNVQVGNSLLGVARPETVRPPGEDHLARFGDEVAFDLWTARAFGVDGEQAAAVARRERFLHWPLAFPEVFSRERPGFDAVVGNPPWEEVTVEELAFYARHRPGLRGLPEGPRREELAALLAERPELEAELAAQQERQELLRAALGPAGGYEGTAGDPDLYKLFCRRYRALLRPGGALGVVLPRSAFLARGSAGFRAWLFAHAPPERLDVLLNTRRWAFDIHPQYSVALVIARRAPAPEDASFEVAGVADSAQRFDAQVRAPGLRLRRAALGPALEVPLLPDQAAADLLAKLRRGTPFALGGGGWRCFPVAELHETNDKGLWRDGGDGRPLWKGASFDQYDPHGAGERPCPAGEAALRKARKPRPGGESLIARETGVSERRTAVARTFPRARIAFRDVTNRTNSRTVIGCLVPPAHFLTNKAPYLAFLEDDPRDEAACLALLNSLPFDWQARRFVEINLNFFVLEGLRVPELDEPTYAALATAAARLSCPDDRFAGFAAATGVEVGPVAPDERDALRADIDARVAHAYGMTAGELDTMFADFTADAVPPAYRERVRERFRALA